MKSIILGVLFVATVAIAFPTQLSYNIGDEFDYTCAALVDSRGQMADGSRTSGSYSTLNGIVAVQVQDFKDGVYLFVMNMFDVSVNVGQGPASAKPGTPLTSQDDEPLGYDMYFAQNTTGEITEIWYNENDSPYFINVKISAINAFQTRVVAPGANLMAAESDPAGYHYSSFVGGNQQTTLLVSKTFTEKDFTSFADPNVKPANLKLNALTSTSVHSEGYIVGASVNQQVVITNANPQASSVASQTRRAAAPNTNTTGFDMNLSSAGQLTIALSQSGQNLRFGSAKKFNMAALTTSTLKKSTMVELGVKGVEFKKNLAPAIEITSSISKLLGSQLTRSKRYTLANKLIRFFNANPAQLTHLTAKISDKLSAKQIQSIFYVLAGVSNVNAVAIAQDALTVAGLNHRSVDRQLTAILALGSSLQDVTPAVMTRLGELARTNPNRRVSTHSLLAASAILGRSKNADVISIGKVLLSDKLNGFLNRASDAEDLTVLLNAVGNAGPNGISLEANIQRLSQYANDEKYKALWISTFRKFPASEVMAKMPANLRAIIDSLDAPRDDLYPFNKNFSRDYKLGGESVNADFSFDLFLGTNFDCNQQYFNYLAYADVEAVVDVYDYTKSAFVAKATYGKANGVLTGNEIYVRFWDDVLYDQQLPTVDCNEHTYPLGHTAPGFSVSYTVWISIIPVTFTASAALELNLSWGWQICDSQLSAQVELIPDAALVISGDADIDLLVIKAGLELDVDLDLELRPQGYIHGTECTIGVDVELTYEPSSAQFDAYYSWDHCKFWIFDCTWGKHNQQTFWSWSTAASNEIVYNQQWKIAH